MEILGKVKTMSNEEIMQWLRKVDSLNLAIALLKADEKVKERIFENMSERAVNMLKSDIQNLESKDAKELIILTNAGILESKY